MYVLLWKRIRTYNEYYISLSFDNGLACYTFNFNLEGNPKISFWYVGDENAIIFFHVVRKFGEYYYEVHTDDEKNNPKAIIEHLKLLVPNFIERYNDLNTDDRDTMANNIENMLSSIKRKNKIDSCLE